MTPNSPQHHQKSKQDVSSKLELGMVKAWQSQAWWLWLFWPLSALYGTVIWIKRKLYKMRVIASYKAPVPVLIVGNITVGGSGKTPLIIELVSYLQHQGIKVGVISRGYGGNESLMPLAVTTQSTPSEVGDEPCLIVRETGVTMAVSPNRQHAIECVLQQAPDVQLIIADDGLQHYKLERDIEWIVVDSARGFGNKQLLPTGFLREPMRRLADATVIYHHAPTDTPKAALSMYLQPRYIQPLFPDVIQSLTPERFIAQTGSKIVYAVSGIGYPQRFFKTLTSLGFDVIERAMPDHHEFTAADLQALTEYPIVITSKDAVKIAPLVNDNTALSQLSIWVLPVNAVLSNECYATLMKQLKAVGVSPNRQSFT